MIDSKEPIPFDPDHPRMLIHRRRWAFASKVRDGDVIDMKTGNILDMGGFKVMEGGQRASEPSGAKFNFNRFGPQIPDPEG